MSLSARGIALQGIGFGVVLIAAQGLFPVQVQAPAWDAYSADDGQATFIQNQNRALLQMIAAFAASGALDG